MGKLIDADVFDSILQDKLDFVHVRECVPVVRCKDCKHRPTDNRYRDDDSTGFAIEFPDSRCPCQCEDGWYNWYPNDDWFCGNGERRDDDALSGC